MFRSVDGERLELCSILCALAVIDSICSRGLLAAINVEARPTGKSGYDQKPKKTVNRINSLL